VSVPPVGCSYCGHSSCGGGGWPEGRDGTNRRARVEGVAGAPRQGRGDFEKKNEIRKVSGRRFTVNLPHLHLYSSDGDPTILEFS
jgi:hypothetical protein